MPYGPLCSWVFVFIYFGFWQLFFFVVVVKLQEFCGAFALTEEKCPRSLMETAQVICAGRVEHLYLANKLTECTITETHFIFKRVQTTPDFFIIFFHFHILQNTISQLLLCFEVYVPVVYSFLSPNCKRMESLSCPSWVVYVSMTVFGTARFWEAFCPATSYRPNTVGQQSAFQMRFICWFMLCLTAIGNDTMVNIYIFWKNQDNLILWKWL